MSKKEIVCVLMIFNVNKDANVILRANEGANCKGYIAHDETSIATIDKRFPLNEQQRCRITCMKH